MFSCELSLWQYHCFNSLVNGFVKKKKIDFLARAKKNIVMDEATDSWNHLIENPKEWRDHRENKAKGLVKCPMCLTIHPHLTRVILTCRFSPHRLNHDILISRTRTAVSHCGSTRLLNGFCQNSKGSSLMFLSLKPE